MTLFLFLVFFDQISKFFAQKLTLPSEYLEPFCNKNIAWSISIVPGVFYFVWIVVFLILFYLFVKSKNNSEKIALTLILSGAISNLIDRLARGCVVDFINFKLWPVFNLADIYITVGIAALIINSFIKPKLQALNQK